jgi:alpha-beta hydrolase superfamily lysophospholipase
MKGSPPGSSAWRILYASTGLDGKPIEVSGVVIASDLPPPVAGRHVVAWAHPTTGVADHCAPSIFEGFFETVPHLTALIALDYVVVTTDYPGLGSAGPHPYVVGLSEGRAVLDAVRAAGQLEKAAASKRFAVWGHSQGGHAALFTGELARTYAPDLTLAGVAAIAPATDLGVLLRDDIAERAGRILGSYALWSWSKVYGAPLEPFVHPDRIPEIDRIARDCIETREEVYLVAFQSLPIPGDFVAPGMFDAEPWKNLIEENRPGRSPIGAPVYIAQGSEDQIVRPTVTFDFVDGLCRAGETVQLDVLSGVGHLRAARVSASAAIVWMRDRLEGLRAPNNCAPR